MAQPHRIAVVDDSPELLGLFGDALRADGVELTLLDGSASLREIEDCRPDLMVIDLRLAAGGLKGTDIIRLVRAHRQLYRVPIIVCSTPGDKDWSELSHLPGLFALAKPFSLEELDACIAMALADRGPAPLTPAPWSFETGAPLGS